MIERGYCMECKGAVTSEDTQEPLYVDHKPGCSKYQGDRKHSVYCTLSDGKVARTQDVGAVQIDWTADHEIIGVEILNVRSVTIDGEEVRR